MTGAPLTATLLCLFTQTTMEQLTTDVAKTRTATERTRPRQRNHADLEKLEDDVTKLNRRWTSSCETVLDRWGQWRRRGQWTARGPGQVGTMEAAVRTISNDVQQSPPLTASRL